MFLVGITGGIGSGKTTVCKIFEILGVPVYYADDRAKAIMVEKQSVITAIKENFGEKAYLPDGNLDRKYIADIVFHDKDRLKVLNGIVHPAVFQDAVEWNQAHADHPYTLKEAALLFESGSYKSLHQIICIYAPEKVRIARVINRDDTTVEEVKARMDKQLPDEVKMERSDFIIYNDSSRFLAPQVLSIHRQLLKMAAKNNSLSSK